MINFISIIRKERKKERKQGTTTRISCRGEVTSDKEGVESSFVNGGMMALPYQIGLNYNCLSSGK
jgi:hypothetical protein